jgi:hypothetical protein
MTRIALAAFFTLGSALIGGPALAQQTARPQLPPQVAETALNTNVISQINRSVEFAKTMPQPAKARPPMEDPEMLKAGEDLYIDRKLVPQRATTDDERAIRVFPGDVR